MDSRNITPSKASSLRQQAEALLKEQHKNANFPLAEADMLKLIHELEVHQIELEMQNEELVIAKEKAEHAEEKYTELYDFAPSGYFTLNTEGDIVNLNLAGAQMLGKERWRLVNSRFAFFLTDDTRIVFLDFLNEVFNSKSIKSCEVTINTNDLLTTHLQLTGILAMDGKHSLISALDISSRKMAEKAMKESEERYALVIDASEQGIWDWNIETNEVFFSEQWKRQIGYQDHEIKNDFGSWIEHLHPDEKETCQNIVQAYLNNPVGHFFLEFRFRHKDGSYRWIYNKASSKINKDGKVVRMFGAHTDITGRKLAELLIKHQNEELQKLNATKDKFFSIIAHDLKSPFNSIMGFSELLVEQITEKNYDGIEKYAGIILKSSQRAMDLLMNLMEWSLSQSGRITFNPVRFDLAKLIPDIMLLFDDIVGQKEIKIKSELPPNVPVFADQSMINTVLRNLISNAIKFTNPGGVILVTVTEEKNNLMVSIKDNGIGIPNDSIYKLFRIDENYSTRGTANETGTGLGLILCKEFIEKHGGEIWVESEVGKGSTFYFTLPYNTESENEITEHQVAQSEIDDIIKKPKILIVEDDEVSESVLTIMLEDYSNEIFHTKTGLEAIEICKQHTDIDLILIDIKMPGIDGFETTRRIREFNKKVVIIAQTAYGLRGDKTKTLDAGCNDYIAKPINKEKLLTLIQKYLNE